MKIRASFLFCLLVSALPGCSNLSNSAIETAQYLWQKNTDLSGTPLNPRLSYLRVTIDGRTSLFALGDVDQDAMGPIEVWYSAQREVLRLQNGRVTGVAGAPTEWRNVTLPTLPPWSDLAKAGNATRWVRVRDVMPGYRYGVRDPLVLRVAAPPARSALRDLDPEHLVWFDEYLDPEVPAATDAKALPAARYAVQLQGGTATAVYGEQCLARDFCFTWQRWPAARPAPAKAQ